MEVSKIKDLLVFEVLPDFAKSLGPVFTHEALKQRTENFLKNICSLVFPDSLV
jgi:hypothetical protein